MFKDFLNDRVWEHNEALSPSSDVVARVNPNDDKFSSKTLANIKRAQWNDYKERFPAIHQQFLDMSMNPDFTLEQVDRVEGNVNQSYARAQANQEATLSRMGVADKSDNNNLAKSLSVAHGENSVRQHGEDRRLNVIAGGSLPSLQTQTV